MKHKLLLLSAALVTGSSAFAATPLTLKTPKNLKGADYIMAPKQQNDAAKVRANAEGEAKVDFSYAGEPYTAYSLNNVGVNDNIYEAFEMPVEIQEHYKDCKITAITILAPTTNTGSNPIKRGIVFVNDDLYAKPTVKESGDFSSVGFGASTIELDEPWTITAEKPIYIGYYFKLSQDCYYIPVDGEPTSPDVHSAWVGTSKKAGEAPTNWVNYSDELGSICIVATIEGQIGPNYISTIGIENNPYYAPGKFYYAFNIKNLGGNNVENIDVVTSVNNGEPIEQNVVLQTPILPGETGQAIVEDVPMDLIGEVEYSAKLVKVNGVDIPEPDVFTSEFLTFNGGWDRKLVMEEATGAWCGYCPAGIVMVERINELYGDDWYTIAVHQGDPMQVSSYMPFINKYVEGFPSSLTNRAIEIAPTAGTANETVDAVHAYYTAFPTYGGLKLTVDKQEDVFNIHAEAQFAYSQDATHQLSFAVVENNVGPYRQTNYYANNALGAMGGWENEKSSVNTIYNDVARELKSFPGIRNSLPTSLVEGETYTYDTTVSAANVTGNDWSVIAMLTNSETGEIIQAAKVVSPTASVKGIEADKNVEIIAANGKITVNGATEVAVYTLDGRRVNPDRVSHGIYIVKADSTVRKVIL